MIPADIHRAVNEVLQRPSCCEEDSGALPCREAVEALKLLDELLMWLAGGTVKGGGGDD